jgi:hypothetical protein
MQNKLQIHHLPVSSLAHRKRLFDPKTSERRTVTEFSHQHGFAAEIRLCMKKAFQSILFPDRSWKYVKNLSVPKEWVRLKTKNMLYIIE